MEKIKKVCGYFSFAEKILWVCSVFIIVSFFMVFDGENYLTLTASLVGVTSLILNAKGNPLGQFLMVIFSVLYGIISYSFRYYGEMLTYLGMTAPMAVFALISWLKNPYEGKKSQVKVGEISKIECVFMIILTGIVTLIFYYVLKFFNTQNLFFSTVSVTTSFLAVYLTFRRSAFYAVAYAMNDIVLIILWTMASMTNVSYVSVVICFMVFFVNDLYGFLNWRKMKIKQKKSN